MAAEATSESLPKISGRLRLRVWELLLLLFFSAIFLSSLYFYVTDFPIIRRYIFGLEDTGSTQEAGTLQQTQGRVRRQKANQSEFQYIDEGDVLFYLDTLVTGPGVEAKIQLKDGGQIALAENTMVKLTFDSQLSLGGVKRQTNLQLVQGSVSGESRDQNIVITTGTGKAASKQSLSKQSVELKPVVPVKPKIAPPVPLSTPSPVAPVIADAPPPPPPPPPPPKIEEKVERLVLSSLLPARGTAYSLPANAPRLEKEVTLSWRTNLRDSKLTLQVNRIESDGGRDNIFDKSVAPNGFEASVSVAIKEPGDYEWLLFERDAKLPTSRSSFRVRAEFEGLELLEPLVSGVAMSSNQLPPKEGAKLLKEFGGITLRWKPFAQARRYRVKIYKSGQEQSAAMEKEVSSPEMTFNRNTVINGRFSYRVFAVLPAGFLASSGLGSFEFRFLPPILMAPKNGEVRDLKTSNSVLFTWQKTHFTDFYEIEVARDQGFSQIVIRKRLRENFFAIPAPEAGDYFWRVKALSSKVSSSPSTASTLIVR